MKKPALIACLTLIILLAIIIIIKYNKKDKSAAAFDQEWIQRGGENASFIYNSKGKKIAYREVDHEYYNKNIAKFQGNIQSIVIGNGDAYYEEKTKDESQVYLIRSFKLRDSSKFKKTIYYNEVKHICIIEISGMSSRINNSDVMKWLDAVSLPKCDGLTIYYTFSGIPAHD